MNDLVTPDLIPQWIPGKTTLDSSGLNWKAITLKGYLYDEQEADIPEMRDYMIVVYRGGRATMRRHCGGPWQTATVGRGVVSLLTRAEQSVWHWNKPIDVRHIYIGHEAIAETATQVFERDPSAILIDDHVSSADTTIPQCLHVLENELTNDGPGQQLLVDAVRTQIAVHLLRRFARVEWASLRLSTFSTSQRRKILEFIEDRLCENFGLESLADSVGMSQFHFARQFRSEFGLSPHAFVIRKRIARAKASLRKSKLPLKVIAQDCGFSDQSHFCRTFRRIVGLTPGEYRRSA